MFNINVQIDPAVYLAGQILGFIIAAFGFFIYICKERRHLLGVKLTNDVLSVVQHAMIGAFTGALINVVAVFREVVFYNRDRKKWASSIVWLFVFIVLMGLSPVLTWAGPVSLLPAAGSAIAVIAFYCRSTHHTRIIGIFAQSLWLAYAIIILNYGAIISNAIQIAAAIIGLIRDAVESRKKTKEAFQTPEGESDSF